MMRLDDFLSDISLLSILCNFASPDVNLQLTSVMPSGNARSSAGELLKIAESQNKFPSWRMNPITHFPLSVFLPGGVTIFM